MARYKAVGAMKQNKVGNGAQTAGGSVTVLNREIRKGLSWKADICTYHIKAAALRGGGAFGGGGRRRQEPSSHREPGCETGPGRRTRMWPFLVVWLERGWSRFHTVRTFNHHGAPRRGKETS